MLTPFKNSCLDGAKMREKDGIFQKGHDWRKKIGQNMLLPMINRFKQTINLLQSKIIATGHPAHRSRIAY
jgi:hypothetical protein